MLQHFIILIAPFALTAVGLILCVGVFLTLKRELQTLNRRVDAKDAERAEIVQAIQAEVEDLKQGLREAEERAGLLVAPATPRSGFNLTKRSLALRMSRLGEKTENIAAALSLPRREVDLLMKVQRIVINSSDNPTT